MKTESTSCYLSKPVARVQTWLVSQFEHGLNFDYHDSTRRFDPWPFMMTEDFKSSEGRPHQAAEVFSSALEIYRSSTSGNQLPQQTELKVSSQTVLLSRFMPHLPRWLKRRDLLGQYAMTTERYGVALQCIAYYLLELPKDVLANISHDSNSKKDILETPIIRLIRKVLPGVLAHAPPTADLYFLVRLTGPVMRKVGKDDNVVYLEACYITRVSKLSVPFNWLQSAHRSTLRVRCFVTLYWQAFCFRR